MASYPRKTTITIACDGTGAFTGFSDQVISGEILELVYAVGSTPLANPTTSLTVTTESTKQSVVTLSNFNGASAAELTPRQPTHDLTGAAALYAAAGTAVRDRIPVSSDRIKLVIVGGGANANGTLTVIYA